MRTLFVILCFLITTCQGFSQVSEIKKLSKANKGFQKNHKRGSEGFSASNGACTSCCCNVFYAELFLQSLKYHKILLEKKPVIQRVTSLDFAPTFATNNGNTFLMLPRLRGNWGLFSTDFRYSALFDNTGFYNTSDWQVIQFNLGVEKTFNFRIGTGFMTEKYTRTAFNEHTIALDLYLKENLITPSFEFRIAKDYTNGSTPRIEVHAKCGYRFIKTDHLDGFLVGGLLFQQYYSKIDAMNIQFGLNFNLH